MIQDTRTILWKEWRELLAQPGGWTTPGWRSNIVAMLVFGIYFSVVDGGDWFRFIGIPVLFGMLVSATHSADSFAGERERHTLERLFATRLSTSGIVIGKMTSTTLYGWLMALLALAAISCTIAVKDGAASLSISSMGGGALLSLLSTSLVSMIGVLVSLRSATVAQAQQTMLALGLILAALPLLLVALAFASIHDAGAPAGWLLDAVLSIRHAARSTLFLATTAGLLVLNAALLALALTRVERHKVVLLQDR